MYVRAASRQSRCVARAWPAIPTSAHTEGQAMTSKKTEKLGNDRTRTTKTYDDGSKTIVVRNERNPFFSKLESVEHRKPKK